MNLYNNEPQIHLQIETFKEKNAYEREMIGFSKSLADRALVSLLIINGGAIVACMSFVSNMITTGYNSELFVTPIMTFVVATAITCFTGTVAYLSQSYFLESQDKSNTIEYYRLLKTITPNEQEFYQKQLALDLNESERQYCYNRIQTLRSFIASLEQSEEPLVREMNVKAKAGQYYRILSIFLYVLSIALFVYGARLFADALIH